MVVERLSYKAKHNLEPEVVERILPLLFVQIDKPSSPAFVLVIFPHWFNTILQCNYSKYDYLYIVFNIKCIANAYKTYITITNLEETVIAARI